MKGGEEGRGNEGEGSGPLLSRKKGYTQKTHGTRRFRALYLSAYPAIRLAELVDVEHEAGLDVGCLVLVDGVALSELVKHLLYLGEKFYGFSLVGGSTELANSVTHGLSVVTVVESLLLLLTDSLE